MFFCRELTSNSLQNIAKAIGKKDHTTVLHGIKTITKEMESNEELKNKVDIIRKKLMP